MTTFAYVGCRTTQRRAARGKGISVYRIGAGAEAEQVNGEWTVKKAIMSRTARRLMEGFVRVPAPQAQHDLTIAR